MHLRVYNWAGGEVQGLCEDGRIEEVEEPTQDTTEECGDRQEAGIDPDGIGQSGVTPLFILPIIATIQHHRPYAGKTKEH